MAKNIPDAIIDLQLAVTEGDAIHVCSAQPTTYTEAATTYKLASDTLSGASYALANGDTSGRKSTITSPVDSTIDSTGTATHVAVTTGTTLLLVTTCTSQALTSGGTVTINAFDHEIGDPT